MMKFLFVFLFLSFEVLALNLKYLTPESVDLSSIPKPPVSGSFEDEADLREVLSFQASRSKEECARATQEAGGYAPDFFGEPYGPLTNLEAQKLIEFHEMLHQEVKFFYKKLKQGHNRLRPFVRSSLVKPCIPLSSSESYPSGHSAAAVLTSLVYGEVFPEKKLEFKKRGELIAEDRILGGVHYPTDVLAGKKVGELVFRALMQNEKFLKDLKELKP